MFLLNNTHDRKYAEVYPGIRNVVFDISERQLRNRMNRDWHQIGSGSIACVIDSSKRVSAFHQIHENRKTNGRDEPGVQYVITGSVIATVSPDQPLTDLLNAYGVRHEYLPSNKFMRGFNVAHLGTALDDLLVRALDGSELSLGALKARCVVTESAPQSSAPRGIPDGITRAHVIAAIEDLDHGVTTDFSESTGYDLIHEGRRYPPKAVLGLAAYHAAAVRIGPYDFKGGESSRAFRVLRRLGFTIEPKRPDEGSAGEEWSEEEVREIVADYFSMLADELAGRPYSKAAHRRELQSGLKGRSEPSIELKHRNISAVLLELNFPHVRGYKPAANFQGLLVTIVQEYLGSESPVISEIELLSTQDLQTIEFDASAFASALVAVPIAPPRPDDGERSRTRQARRFDFRAKDDANRKLGSAGEEFVLNYERWRLREAGRADLAQMVSWLSADKGDGAGYDIESFEPDGAEIFIEVKTTRQGSLFPFLLSANELQASREKGLSYRLYRVFDFGPKPKLYVVAGPIDAGFGLRPTTYEARLPEGVCGANGE